MLKFNEFGFIESKHPIFINQQDLEEHFVFNIQRRFLFEHYLRYVKDLKSRLNIHKIEQWINGSFISRKENPNDIDVVSFIPFNQYKISEKDLNELKKEFYPLVDAYHVCDYPENHRNFVHSQYDRIEWDFLFSKIRGQKSNKSFIKIYI